MKLSTVNSESSLVKTKGEKTWWTINKGAKDGSRGQEAKHLEANDHRG